MYYVEELTERPNAQGISIRSNERCSISKGIYTYVVNVQIRQATNKYIRPPSPPPTAIAVVPGDPITP